MTKVLASGLALLGIGAAAGGIASTALSASAATTTTTAPGSSASGGSTSSTPGSSTRPDPPRGGFTLPLSGTVTAVGTSDVTIKTSSDTTTYAVTNTSDIDKSGEATLSDLAVGDAVTFSTVTTNGTTAIDKLHAGNAALDMPQGGPGDGPGAGHGVPPSGSSGSGSSA